LYFNIFPTRYLTPARSRQNVEIQDLTPQQREAHAAGKPLRIHVERFNPALRLSQRLGFEQIEDKGVYLFLE